MERDENEEELGVQSLEDLLSECCGDLGDDLSVYNS